MERLTYTSLMGNRVSKGACASVRCDAGCDACGIDKLISRLWEYEETGMEPEEINGLREFCESHTSTTLDHIYELVQAEREGRLVVTPPTGKRKPAGQVSEKALQALEHMGANTHSGEDGA